MGQQGAGDQLSLLEEPEFENFLAVVDDLGAVGRGVSNAHFAQAMNGSEYIVKGRVFAPGEPYAAANELIAVRMAEAMGLPCLDHRILRMGGDLLFASARMPGDSFYETFTQELFDRCVNRHCVYDLVAFDFWLYNNDRHEGNLLARKMKSAPGDPMPSLTMLLNDHSRCLMKPLTPPAQLQGWLRDTHGCVRLPYLSHAILDVGLLSMAIRKCEAMPDDRIYRVVRSVPNQMLAEEEKVAVEGFLTGRKRILRDLFREERFMFTRLGTGDL